MTPLLLLIDFQQDYLGADGLSPAGGLLVERAAALLQHCRSAGIPVVHVWTTVSRADDRRMPHWKRNGTWSCEEGTPGHASPEALLPATGEPVVHKRFFSGFSSGILAPLLAERRADTLIVAGLHLHACVRETVLQAYENGLTVWVADDAVGSDDPLHAAITRRYLESRAARFATASELSRLFAGSGSPAAIAGTPVSAAALEVDAGIGEATARARAAWPLWAGVEPAVRRDTLERLAVLLDQRAPLFADRMARAIGKPVSSGIEEVHQGAAIVRAVAREALDEPDTGALAFMRRRAVGVVAVITPWNNPFLIPLGKIAAALFYGNTVVWKPAPAAASLAAELLACLRTAGCAEGSVTVIQGDHRRAASLMADALIDAVTLTGGVQAGYSAQEICARRHIPLQAELGGNNAAVVWPDADLKIAATRLAAGAFAQAGQRCTANRRAIVHRDCRDEFLEELVSAVAALRWGDPLDPATCVGPLVSDSQRERIAALVKRATAHAERVIVPHGGRRPTCAPFPAAAYYPPTLVCCDDPRQEIVQEESFGPVLVVQSAADWDQAISLCNGVRQGLAAAIFTNSVELQQRFLREAQAGVLKINESTAGAAAHLPFGGWKSSGVGPPEHGAADREFYTRLQAVYPTEPRDQAGRRTP